MRDCNIEGCDRPSRSRGWCKLHYERWRRINHPTTALCNIEDCEKRARHRGLCGMHYARLRKYGTIDLPVRAPKIQKVCSIEGCTNELTYKTAKGLCGKHYQRLKDRGTTADPVRTPWPENCAVAGCTGEVAVKSLSLCWRHYQHHWHGKLGHTKEKETHGLYYTPEYRTWLHMKNRCLNTRCDSYADYGGRGITVCERWRKSFTAFYEDMGKKPSASLSINRIDNDGNYSCGHCPECLANGWPSNCEWADGLTQRLNQRIRNNNRSGYRNVSWDRSRLLWAVRIKRDKRYVFGGRFATLEEAVTARDNFLLKYENGNREFFRPAA